MSSRATYECNEYNDNIMEEIGLIIMSIIVSPFITAYHFTTDIIGKCRKDSKL